MKGGGESEVGVILNSWVSKRLFGWGTGMIVELWLGDWQNPNLYPLINNVPIKLKRIVAIKDKTILVPIFLCRPIENIIAR